jgi:hypothetical protein
MNDGSVGGLHQQQEYPHYYQQICQQVLFHLNIQKLLYILEQGWHLQFGMPSKVSVYGG